jgi:hypothetical protein
MAILVFAIFARDKKMRNRILLAWLRKNWFKIRYFNLGATRQINADYPQFDPIWIRRFSILILLSSGILSFLLTSLGSLVRIEKLRKIPIFISVKKSVFRK